MAEAHRSRGRRQPVGRVVELFAGVGGFRLGLAPSGWEVAWANQWEPSRKVQHAFNCYMHHFGAAAHVNVDIAVVLDEIEGGKRDPIPDHDLLVGGFPCQDYSVAKTAGQALGIQGEKGALWWAIHQILVRHRPRLVFLENVDRLLKSPAAARGSDFAVILSSMADLGYFVEWRIVNAADYGFPQRRRRVFLVGRQAEGPIDDDDALAALTANGVLAQALPVAPESERRLLPFFKLKIIGDLPSVHVDGPWVAAKSPFRSAGVTCGRLVWTTDLTPRYRGRRHTLRDVLQPHSDVPHEFSVPRRQIPQWRALKNGGPRWRVARSGFEYWYTEGRVPFPDDADRPARTILTAEGGSSPSRFKHVVAVGPRSYRRLTPVELERLNGFPDGWTDTGMPDSQRAFMMGNAIVVGLVRRIGKVLARA